MYGEDGMKICSNCKIEKPRSEFHKNKANKDGLAYWCKLCNRAAIEQYRTTPKGKEVSKKKKKRYRAIPKGKEEKKRSDKKWLATSKGKLFKRKDKLRARYGITLEEYDKMLKDQGGVCAICGTDNPGVGFDLFLVDHDHKTGKVRGLLCNRCNIILEYPNDLNVAKYLR
jgi:hypothetical protein